MKYSKLETSNLIFLTEPTIIISEISNYSILFRSNTVFYNLVGIIILNMFGYRYLRTRNHSLTVATKFILSMFFAFITMNIAGGVEILRQHYCFTSRY